MFNLFQAVLQANNDALAVMADLEEKLAGDYLFDAAYLRAKVEAIEARMDQIVASLNKMSANRWPELNSVRQRIAAAVAAELSRSPAARVTGLVLPLPALVDPANEGAGGGKAAGLLTALAVGLPVPAGFVATLTACRRFLEAGGLEGRIKERLAQVSAPPGEPQSIRGFDEAAAGIRDMILAAPLPPELEAALVAAYRAVAPAGEPVAVRSSAATEDSPTVSFAGQYASFLGAAEDTLPHYYREVVASLFGARALLYLRSQGLDPAEGGMAVLVQRMVAPVCAGVLFTRDPDACASNEMVIGATWGLAAGLVSGSVSGDTYIVDRDTGTLTSQKLRPKPTRLELLGGRQGGQMEAVPVPPELVEAPCVGAGLLALLREAGLKLEEQAARPQDVEWAWGGATLYVVQSRPLRLADPVARCSVELAEVIARAEVLLEGATPGAYGAAAGPVFVAAHDLDPDAVPQGSVLVVPHTSPRLGPLLPRVAAVVAEVGAATGHLALLAREYRVPLLVDAKGALSLPQGVEVTVDASSGKVLRGRLEELVKLAPRRDRLFAATSIHGRLKAVLDLMVPLSLVDARQPNFRAAGCRTYHDITRFAHEKAVELMFGVIDDVGLRHDAAVRLRSELPINLYVVDLGGGLRDDAGPKWIRPEDIASVPMRALWKGMTHTHISWAGPVPVDLGGFLRVVAETAVRPPEDYWDKTYALVGANYVNFSSRLGYHFSTIDGYCGAQRNDNYLNFTFKGGAADEERRCRRARVIAHILEKLGFEVEMHSDMVRGRFRKRGCAETEERLELLGRLMGYVRQMDMIMSDDQLIELMAQRFLDGKYRWKDEEFAGGEA